MRSLNKQSKKLSVYLNISPLSVNKCWKGQRFKTKDYKDYEKELLLRLPVKTLPAPPYQILFEFGLSNICSDWDNPIKPLQDILQKKYGFNDKDIMQACVKKVKVDKGREYFIATLESLDND